MALSSGRLAHGTRVATMQVQVRPADDPEDPEDVELLQRGGQTASRRERHSRRALPLVAVLVELEAVR